MNLKEKRELIINGNLYKVILIIALPIMVSTLVQRAYTLTDMYFLGKIGKEEIAALTFVDPIINIVINIAMGLSVPMITMVSQNIGAKKYEKAKSSIGSLLYIAFIISSVVAILGLLFSTNLLKLLKLQGNLLFLSSTYLKIILFGTIFTFINSCYISIKQAEGNSMKPLYMNVFSLILNLILNPIFIFQFKLGIIGAALATIVSKALLSSYGLWDIFTGSGLKIKRKHLTVTFKELKRIIAIGLPAIITKIASPFGNALINSYAVSYGPSLLAAVGLGNKINSIFFSLNSSLCASMTTLTGQNLGNNNPKRVEEAVKKITILSVLLGIVGTFTILYFNKSIISLFSKDIEVFNYTKEFLFITTPTIFMWGIYQIVSGVYQGSGFTKISMWITLIRLWAIRIPLIYILHFYIGGRSLWYSTAIATNVIGVVSIGFYLSKSWKKKNKYV